MSSNFDKHSYPDYGKMIHASRYARWIEDEARRETWPETVERYLSFMQTHLKGNCNYRLTNKLRDELRTAVLNLDIMPSMRCLMTAGPALLRDNICAYNCAYMPVDSPRAFDEAMYILMNGTGVGFSVERQSISKLPVIAEDFYDTDTNIVVSDSRLGWAKALKELIALLYGGMVPTWDVSRLRPSGAVLKTFGGRSSGPDPLVDLFHFTIELFKHAKGRKLNSIECHDLMCKIGQVVVVGGVRRSAMISLSNLSDARMRDAKTGMWSDYHVHRHLANNSVAYTEKPDMEAFMAEWMALVKSKSGERGIFNRAGVKAMLPERRDSDHEFGTNPCSEIILRPYQFCNLTEAVVRSEDTYDTLANKVRLATILGTFQATLTSFKYIRKAWTNNTEEERLLGVSLTGICDNEIMSKGYGEGYDDWPLGINLGKGNGGLPRVLKLLKETAIGTNIDFAKRLGIEASKAITCVKPSGTVSQLVDSASGIHPRYSDYYIRTVRGDIKDPLSTFLIEQGVPNEPSEVSPDSTVVFSFPMKAPDGAVMRDDSTALEQLRLWRTYQLYWCEHKPSVTVYVKEHEWLEVGAWVYKNFDLCSGMSFLPFEDHSYKQAPYQPIDKKAYAAAVDAMPSNLDWSKLPDYEAGDTTTGSQELACTGGSCEINTIGAV